MEIWNRNLHRWINKGTKGIALLRENGNRYHLDYVFDVADTNSSYNREVSLWQYDERYENAVIETLSNSFGDLKVDVTVRDAVICAVHNAVQDNEADYLNELKYAKENSFLEGLDDVNLNLRFRQTAETSAAYMIMQRMNLSDTFDEYEFQYIRDFNTPETISILGNMVSAISEEALRDISQTIRAEQKRERNQPEFFAENKNRVYNIDRETDNNERNEENDRRNNLQPERRLSDTELNGTAGGISDRQIRNDEENVSEAVPQKPVLVVDDKRRAVEPFSGDRQDSDRTDTADSIENGRSGGSNRSNESQIPNDVDRVNEQLSAFSERNSTVGAGIQLSLDDIFPNIEQQQNIVRQAEQAVSGSAFSMPEQIIDEVLTSGGNHRDSVLEIAVQYSKNKSNNIEFLKEHYGTGGKGFIFNNSKVSAWWNPDGMRISYGDTAIGKGHLLSWEQIDKRISELLELGRFAPQETLDKINQYERSKAASAFWYMERDLNYDEYPDLHDLFKKEWFDGGYPDSTGRITEMFKQPEVLNELISVTNTLAQKYGEDKRIMRFKMYSPDKVLSLLQDLQSEHKQFTANEFQLPVSQMFITEDEIDRLFIRGTGTESGKIRVYLYFQEHSDLKERIKFLKNEYGSGGYGGGIFNEWHDAKGITFSRDDIFSPSAKINISWTNAAKRIDSLIKSNRYMTEKEISEDIPNYLSEQEQNKIRHEKYMYLHDMDNLPPEEKLSTLPKRIQYFTEIIEKYESEFFSEYGVEELLNKTEIEIVEAIKDSGTRQKLSDCMQKIGGAATDAVTRNCGYKFSEELRSIKVISLKKIGDFYEIYGDEAIQAAEALDISLTRRHTENGDIPMTGFPVYILEEYTQILTSKGYIVDFSEKEYDIGFGSLGNGTTVWNRLEEENHDYKTIAHIEDNGEVKYYEDLPDDVKQIIEHKADIEKANYEKRTFRDTMYNVPYTELYRTMSAYSDLKENNPETVVIVQVGKHYEVLGNDAKIASEVWNSSILERALPSTDVKTEMTGFTDIRQLEQHKNQLIQAGYRVLTASNIGEDGVYQRIERYETESADKENVKTDNNLIGKKITVDNRNFIIENINDLMGTVSLRDVTFQNEAGFPVFMEESLDWLKLVIDSAQKDISAEVRQEKNDEPLKPVAPIPKAESTNTVIYPEIPMPDRNNFKITNDNLSTGGPKEKFLSNIAAIEVLKKTETEHRLATLEEQEILSHYVGWGGLQEAFDESKDNWHTEYAKLKNLLTDEEYAAARESTLTSFYTPPVVIRSIYKGLENLGFEHGNILDPAAGIGNFEGMLPDSMSDSKVYGVELDSISGKIAQQLYQKNSFAVQGYEDTTLPDSFFDVAVGNVPFGNFKVMDKKYDKNNFLIHDYFFAKTLDKIRPGGVIAFITSSGTLDKSNSNVRRYIAQRADLVGAIRLPNNTFKSYAGTEVTSDILFLQKRERMTDIEPAWVHLGTTEEGYNINQYFIDNPDMILGEMTEVSGPFGPELTCKPYEDTELEELLNGAIQNIHGQITEYVLEDISNDEDLSIPADPNVKNFSYTIADGNIYFRENSRMNKVETTVTGANRIKGMVELRDCVRELIEYQTEDYPENDIKAQQTKLNKLYDEFTAKYGLINSRGNSMAFSSDSSYFLLCSLEVLNENGELERKADMFTKRTIGAKKEIKSVDTASEALAVSLGEKARIDMNFMTELTGKSEEELYEDLKGVIFLNPLHTSENDGREKYLTADEYLSGNVREKLEWAKRSADLYPNDYTVNVEALTAVQPKDLSASEITVRLGTTWIPPEYIQQFTFELLNPSYSARQQIKVHYSKLTGNWNVSGKSSDRANVKINNTYGTKRVNALKIIEETLNLRDVRIFDYVENEKGNRAAVLNSKQTTIAQQKQDAIKTAFSDWIWKDPKRRENLTKIYNEKFNSIRTREYDGSHIVFSGMNPEIQLRQHQKNAVARIMYGGNSLLGHVVGAGKTWTMAAAAMEMKRLGLCNKPMFVVPNHLTEQWASEFLQLYPSANILVTTKKDFETKNRKKFCGRIATGDYDAIIIGHSQFEKIPMSVERQRAILEQQLDEILDGIAEAKANNAERFTVKQMERTRKSVEIKIAKLNDTSRKDDVITFEELGVDRMFVDEAHNYKNLFLVSKMRNVGGIAQTDAQKSSDMFMKCRYLDELTGGKRQYLCHRNTAFK